jgi:hypothetical protein
VQCVQYDTVKYIGELRVYAHKMLNLLLNSPSAACFAWARFSTAIYACIYCEVPPRAQRSEMKQ